MQTVLKHRPPGTQNRQKQHPMDALPAAFLHFVDQGKYYGLLLFAQSRPSFQEFSLRLGQGNRFVFFCKQLGKRDAERLANFFQRRDRRDHIFAVPRGDRRLRQTRAFCKLILCLAPVLPIRGYGRENIFHLHHPFACVFRKVYFCSSLPFNNFGRIFLTVYTSSRRICTAGQKCCFFACRAGVHARRSAVCLAPSTAKNSI